MTHEKEFVMVFSGRGVDNEQVVGFDRSGDQALTDEYFVGAANGIAQPGGTFEVQLLRGFEHLAAQAVKEVFTLTSQEGTHFLNNFGVLHGINATSTRARAAIKVQAETGVRGFSLWR